MSIKRGIVYVAASRQLNVSRKHAARLPVVKQRYIYTSKNWRHLQSALGSLATGSCDLFELAAQDTVATGGMENDGSKLERIIFQAGLIVVARKSGEGIMLDDAVDTAVRIDIKISILSGQITNLARAVAGIGVRAAVLVANAVDRKAASIRLSRGTATAQVGIVVAAGVDRCTAGLGIFVC